MAKLASHRTVCDLTALAYAACLDRRKWQWFINRLHKVSGGAKVALYGHDLGENDALGMISAGFSNDSLDSYRHYYAGRNAWAPFYARLPTGKAVFSDAVLAREDLYRSEFYADWLRPQDNLVSSAGTILSASRDQVVMLTVCLRDDESDSAAPEWMRLLGAITPALQQAFEIQRELGDLALQNRIFSEGLEPRMTGILALDRNRRLVFRNGRGAQMLEQGDLVRRSPNGRIQIVDAAGDQHLSKSMLDLVGQNASFPPRFFTRDRNGALYAGRIITFPASDDPPQLPTPFAPDEAALILLTPSQVADPTLGPLVPDTSARR